MAMYAQSSGTHQTTSPVFTGFAGLSVTIPEGVGKYLVMSLYGGMSKGERNRIKTRVRSSMGAQVAIEGRFQGGRPPYGYQLGDAGQHRQSV